MWRESARSFSRLLLIVRRQLIKFLVISCMVSSYQTSYPHMLSGSRNRLPSCRCSRAKTKTSIGSTKQASLIVEKMDLEEHVLFFSLSSIRSSAKVQKLLFSDIQAVTADQTATEHNAVCETRLVISSSEDMFKIRQSSLVCWLDELPKDKAWMWYQAIRLIMLETLS